MISVVMAVYNIGKKEILTEAVLSILHQTETDIELIICDDASTDGTSQWLNELAENDNRIKLLKNTENRKAGCSRNRCISCARGNYIAIMDGDDISAPERLSKQADFLDNNPQFDFVGTGSQYFKERIGDMGDEGYWFCETPEKKDLLFTPPFLHATIMFRKEALAAVSGYSSEKLVTRCEDFDMLLRMYAAGLKGANIKDVLYFYRVDEQTLKKRKYRYRFNETAVKWRGFYRCGLFPKGIPYAIKPLIVGLIPVGLLEKLKKRHYEKKR